MTTATVRIENVVAPQRRQEHFAQANSAATERKQGGEGALPERNRHEEWTQGIEQAWQDHMETLQQCLCELLVKNQQLRMALTAADTAQRGHRDARAR